jgi:hypothetical protein
LVGCVCVPAGQGLPAVSELRSFGNRGFESKTTRRSHKNTDPHSPRARFRSWSCPLSFLVVTWVCQSIHRLRRSSSGVGIKKKCRFCNFVHMSQPGGAQHPIRLIWMIKHHANPHNKHQAVLSSNDSYYTSQQQPTVSRSPQGHPVRV